MTRSDRGFTLLEMMIALSILAMSLTWLIEATARAVDSENHARLVTTATFLARQTMVELEDELQEKGMQDDAFASEKSGEFEEAAYKRFRWTRVVDKITLPGTDALQTALGAAGTNNSGSSSSSVPGLGGTSMGAGSSIGMLSGQFGVIKDVLEQGIRRATVRVVWSEHGQEKFVEVAEYLTDPRRVDQAIALPAVGGVPGMGTPGTGGTSGPSNGMQPVK